MDSMVLIEGFWGAGEEGDSFSPQNPACFFFFKHRSWRTVGAAQLCMPEVYM